MILASFLSTTVYSEERPAGKRSVESVEAMVVSVVASVENGIVAGNSVELTIVVKNRGKRVIVCELTHFDDLNLSLIDSKGKPLPLTRYGQAYADFEFSSSVKVHVEPGQMFDKSLNLERNPEPRKIEETN